MTYYTWSGVGELLDLDGENDLPLAGNREQAISIFAKLVRERPEQDWVLWERNGMTARVIRVYVRPEPTKGG